MMMAVAMKKLIYLVNSLNMCWSIWQTAGKRVTNRLNRLKPLTAIRLSGGLF